MNQAGARGGGSDEDGSSTLREKFTELQMQKEFPNGIKMNSNKMQYTTGPSRQLEGINPTEPYLSQTMLYEKFSCRGFLKKYPENPTFW